MLPLRPKSICWAGAKCASAPSASATRRMLPGQSRIRPQSGALLRGQPRRLSLHGLLRNENWDLRTLRIGPGRLLWTNGVSDRSSDVYDVVGGEDIRIVYDLVVAQFGTNKHVSPNVVAKATSDVDHEMIGTGVAGAEVYAVGGRLIAIETSALPTDSAEQIEAGFLPQAGLIHAVEGEDQGAIRLTAGSAKVPIACPPVDVEGCADAPLENDISAEIHIEAALFGADHVGARIQGAVASPDPLIGRGRRGEQGSTADIGVALLGGGEAAKDYDCKQGCNEGGLSQEEPPKL